MDNAANSENQSGLNKRDIPRLICDDERMREALRKAAEVAERRRAATQATSKPERGKS